jgi:phenylpropionate dioxygenase-like ring-hydroxylating dioxygenase large terminal subunit
MGDDVGMASDEFTNAHPALREFWHPAALSCDVGEEPVAVRLAGQGWALARLGGEVVAFADACPHRRARLSAGSVSDGTLQCTYHGWRFSRDGQCVHIPALIPPRPRLRRRRPERARPALRCQPIGQPGFALAAAESGLTIRQDSSTA